MNHPAPGVLVTICARGGSKGVPSKNIRPLLGKPLIVHTIEQALEWGKANRVVVSTDSDAIAAIARSAGAEVPFQRPSEMATDTAGKLPVIVHALESSEAVYQRQFDVVVDLDPTSPVRVRADIERGWNRFLEAGRSVCFSVVKARKNPYFNMVERGKDDHIRLVKEVEGNVTSRQMAPKVWDMNASIYLYARDFLLSHPVSLWQGDPEIFEMPPESAFDIDEERDFVVTEGLLRLCLERKAGIHE